MARACALASCPLHAIVTVWLRRIWRELHANGGLVIPRPPGPLHRASQPLFYEIEMSHSSCFIPDTTLADLGLGAQISLYGFRACAFEQKLSKRVISTFNDIFGNVIGGHTLDQFECLVRRLGRDGSRRLKLAAPGCSRLTHDEASILGSIAAAQKGDARLRDKHLRWLLAACPSVDLADTVQRVAIALNACELRVITPEEPLEAARLRVSRLSASTTAVGHA